MAVRSCLTMCAAIALACAGPACSAEMYKWVDERGVTNYSNQAPGPAAKPSPMIENRVSTYTPDPMLVRAMEAERTRMIDDLRTGRRARDLQADWLARQYFAAVTAQPADACPSGASCSEAYGYAPAGYAVGRYPPRILPQAQLTPGVTAGHVTGSTGFIPGYSAYAPRTTSMQQRPVREAARPGGGPGASAGGGPRSR